MYWTNFPTKKSDHAFKVKRRKPKQMYKSEILSIERAECAHEKSVQEHGVTLYLQSVAQWLVFGDLFLSGQFKRVLRAFNNNLKVYNVGNLFRGVDKDNVRLLVSGPIGNNRVNVDSNFFSD